MIVIIEAKFNWEKNINQKQCEFLNKQNNTSQIMFNQISDLNWKFF